MNLLYVTAVHPDSYGEAIGLRAGDYLIFLGLMNIAGDRQNLYKILERSKRFHTLHYIRDGKWHRTMVKNPDFGIETEARNPRKMATARGHAIVDMLNATTRPDQLKHVQEYHLFMRQEVIEEEIDYSDPTQKDIIENEEDIERAEAEAKRRKDNPPMGPPEYKFIQPKGLNIMAFACPPIWLLSKNMYKLAAATMIMYSLSALQGIEYFVLWYLLLSGLFAKNHGHLVAGFLSSEGWKSQGILFATNPYEIVDMIKISDMWMDRELGNKPPEELDELEEMGENLPEEA